MDEGEVPSGWKEAQIVPIHKKGNKAIMANFRPVTLTTATQIRTRTIMPNQHPAVWKSVRKMNLSCSLRMTQTFREIDEDEARHPFNQQALQQRIDRIAQWAHDWKMEINPTKSKVMHLGRRNPGLSYLAA